MKKTAVLFACMALLMTYPADAHAYLDPGTIAVLERGAVFLGVSSLGCLCVANLV